MQVARERGGPHRAGAAARPAGAHVEPHGVRERARQEGGRLRHARRPHLHGATQQRRPEHAPEPRVREHEGAHPRVAARHRRVVARRVPLHANVRLQPDVGALVAGRESRARERTGRAAHVVGGRLHHEALDVRERAHGQRERTDRAHRAGGERRCRVGGVARVVGEQPRVGRRLVAHGRARQRRAHGLGVHAERPRRQSGEGEVGEHAPAAQAVAHPLAAAARGPAARDPVPQVGVGGRVARRAAAAGAGGQPVLGAPGAEQVAEHEVVAVELPHLAERAIGHEIDGVVAVLHGQGEVEAPELARAVERDELPLPVRLDLPPRREAPVEARDAEVGGANVGRVGERDAARAARARAGAECVAEPELLEPAAGAPDAVPAHLGDGRGDAAGARGLERAAEHVGAEGERVRNPAPAHERRAERVVDDEAVDVRAVERERLLRIRRPRERVHRQAGLLARDTPRHGEQPPVDDDGGEVLPAHHGLDVEERVEERAARVRLAVTRDERAGGGRQPPAPGGGDASLGVHHDRHPAGLQRRLDAPRRGGVEAHLGQLEERRHGEEQPVAVAERGHGARGELADAQLDEHRLGERVRASRRWLDGARLRGGRDVEAGGGARVRKRRRRRQQRGAGEEEAREARDAPEQRSAPERAGAHGAPRCSGRGHAGGRAPTPPNAPAAPSPSPPPAPRHS